MTGTPDAVAAAPGDGTALEEHFAFGANWRRFLSLVDEGRIAEAVGSLRHMLSLGEAAEPLAGTRFLDAGCGSGLFSLAARRLGAEVVSFDFDPQSVACAEGLRRRFDAGGEWRIETGSVLDGAFLETLGTFETVYSWGVLHHTGAMWPAIESVTGRVAPGGRLFIAIYNDQGRLSELWAAIKAGYARLPAWLRTPYVAGVGGVYFGGKAAAKAALWPVRLLNRGGVRRGGGEEDFRLTRSGDRGMSRWYDLVDWVGGHPFEVATPDELINFLTPHGFRLEKLRSVGGRLGCNELVLRRDG